MKRLANGSLGLLVLLALAVGLKTPSGAQSLTSNAIVTAVQSGTWNIGTVTTVTTVSAVTAISNALPAGTNAIGTIQPGNTANTTPWLVSQVPTTTAGSSTCYLTSAASTNATNCKASAGNVYGVYIINTTSTNYFLRMYNSSGTPTCSSSTGFIESVPALGAASNGGGISRMQEAQAYTTGIAFCLTGGGGNTDNTNAATGVYLTILYK